LKALALSIPSCPLTHFECSHFAIGAHPGCLFPQKGQLKRFALHETVFRQGAGCRGIWRVRDGLLALRRHHPDGRRSVVRVVRPGEIFGWSDAFMTETHRWEGWTLTASSLWYMPASDWASYHPGDAHDHILALAFSESQQLEKAVLRLSALKAEDRLLAFLLSLADGLDTFPVVVRTPLRRGDIADAVAITPESCSRILHRLEEQGLVTWRRTHTAVIDERAVARVAEVMELY